MQTYPEMSEHLKSAIADGDPAALYAAARIEELENSLADCNAECETAMKYAIAAERQLHEVQEAAKAQSEAVQRDWLSPAEAEGLRRRVEETEAALRLIVCQFANIEKWSAACILPTKGQYVAIERAREVIAR